MNKQICKAAVLSVTVFFGGCTASVKQDTIKVCYVPFNAATLTAMTPSAIFEYSGSCQTIPRNSQVASEVTKLVSDTSNPENNQPNFDFMVVRVGILDGDKPTFVDQNGVVLIHTQMYQLPKDTLEKLSAILGAAFKDVK